MVAWQLRRRDFSSWETSASWRQCAARGTGRWCWASAVQRAPRRWLTLRLARCPAARLSCPRLRDLDAAGMQHAPRLTRSVWLRFLWASCHPHMFCAARLSAVRQSLAFDQRSTSMHIPAAVSGRTAEAAPLRTTALQASQRLLC